MAAVTAVQDVPELVKVTAAIVIAVVVANAKMVALQAAIAVLQRVPHIV